MYHLQTPESRMLRLSFFINRRTLRRLKNSKIICGRTKWVLGLSNEHRYNPNQKIRAALRRIGTQLLSKFKTDSTLTVSLVISHVGIAHHNITEEIYHYALATKKFKFTIPPQVHNKSLHTAPPPAPELHHYSPG